MAVIHLQTRISAPVDVVFDLARSIDLHKDSLAHTEERPIAGVTSGLIGMGEDVTWEARHLGMRWKMKVKISAYDRPRQFRDEMVKGPFKFMKHEHHFEQTRNGMLMTDRFEFASPGGIIGRLFDALYLTAYLRKLLETRNAAIKEQAERAE